MLKCCKFELICATVMFFKIFFVALNRILYSSIQCCILCHFLLVFHFIVYHFAILAMRLTVSFGFFYLISLAHALLVFLFLSWFSKKKLNWVHGVLKQNGSLLVHGDPHFQYSEFSCVVLHFALPGVIRYIQVAAKSSLYVGYMSAYYSKKCCVALWLQFL